MKNKKKKIRKLELDLIQTLLDPQDSDQRKRYLKRWIYGESPKEVVSRSVQVIRELKPRRTIWSFLARVLTGDDDNTE